MLASAVRFGKVALGTIVLTIAYGVVHDMGAAHVISEYYRLPGPCLVVLNPPIVPPLVWHAIETWQLGAIAAGAVIGAATVFGKAPSLAAGAVLAKVGRALLVVLVMAMLFLLASLQFGRSGALLVAVFDELVPSLHRVMSGMRNNQIVGYGGSLVSAVWLSVSIARDRRSLSRTATLTGGIP